MEIYYRYFETFVSYLWKQPIKTLLTVALSTIVLLLIFMNRVILDAIFEGDPSESCKVDLASYGNDDSTKFAYVKTSGGSSEDVLARDEHGNLRSVQLGLTIVELDPKTCTTRNRQNFDTYASSPDRVQLLETLKSATAGTIITGVTADTAEHENDKALREFLTPFFEKYNINLTGLVFRGKFIFIMQKGYPKKTIFKIKPRYGECLKITVAIHGADSDVTFKQV